MRDMLIPRGPKRAIDENSEASWLKRRRVAVQEGADGVDVEACVVPEDRVVGHDLWELTHEREREFQQMKERAKLFQAVSEGAVSWSALSPAEQETCAAWWSHHDDLDRKHLARPRLNKFPREPPNLIGHTVWYEEGVQQEVNWHELNAWTRALGLRSEESPLKASILVCSCATSPSNLQLLWAVALSGKRCMDVEFLRSAGARGTCLKYKSMVATRRTVFITPRFARRQAEIAYDVLFFCRPSTRSSNWTHVRERDEFMHAVQRATVARKPTQVAVFGEPEDRWDDVGSVRLFYERGDLPKLLRLDRALSWVGLGAAEWQEHSWQ